MEESNLEQEQVQEQTDESSTAEQSPELKAALELIKESNATIAALNKQIGELKQVNAKLAIQQSFSAPPQSAEDILNKMF